METDIRFETLMAQMKKLELYADELLEIRSGLIRHKNLLGDAWIADEAELVNDLIDRLIWQTRWLVDELYEIVHDGIKIYVESFEKTNL